MDETTALVRLPEHWPVWAVATVAMVLLAGLDVLGAVAAKEWAERRLPLMLVLGLVAAVVLFVLYAATLQYAELTTVTFGWVVMLQVGVLLLDRFRYGVELSPGAWVAVGVLMVAQAYLVLVPPTQAAAG